MVGPLLSFIYISDVDSRISSEMSKYADDTKINQLIKFNHNLEAFPIKSTRPL